MRKQHRYRNTLLALTMTGLSAFGFGSAFASGTAVGQQVPVPELEWDTTLVKFQFDHNKFIGQRFSAECPPARHDQDLSGVYGTDAYPSDNSLCIAALHAGKISRDGGNITVQLNAGQESYPGSERNGVATATLPATRRSFSFVDGPAAPIDNPALVNIPRIKWDTKFTATGLAYRRLAGQQFTFECPAARSDMRPRTVYGTDTYAFHSMLCRAAVHAGRITLEGGLVTVRIDGGAAKLIGSIRNGVETANSSGGDRTLSFVDSPARR